MAKQRRTLRYVIGSREQSAFVGRQAQLALFEANMGYALDDERRRWIFNVHGAAGVGKTFLLKQWSRIAQAHGALHAHLTDTIEDLPDAMAAIAAAFSHQGVRLRRFEERHQRYQEHRYKVQADPAAPQDAASLFTKAGLRIALRVASEVPGVGIVAAPLNDPTVIEAADRLRRYLVGRFRDHEDVRLLLSPVEVLSPLLVDDLAEAAETRQLALFLDAYERVSDFMEPWLLALVGDLPPEVTITIAGRDPLASARWAQYLGLLADVPLGPFTELEARELLAHEGVTDPELIEVTLAVSGRLPLMVASLAAARPGEAAAAVRGGAVERFLRWEADPQRREAMLALALPRWFNQDLVGVLLGEAATSGLWDWLRSRPFVTDHEHGYRCHQLVRDELLQLHRRDSPTRWRRRHDDVAAHHRAARAALGLDESAGWADPTWQLHLLEERYHELCAAPGAHLGPALDQLLVAIDRHPAVAYRWIEMLGQAGADSGAQTMAEWGERLRDASAATSTGDWIGPLTVLIQRASLPVQRRADALRIRARAHQGRAQFEAAIADYSLALQLAGNDAGILLARGDAYRAMGQHDEALADFSCVIEAAAAASDPGSELAWAIADRAATYRAMGLYDEALADYSKAIELSPRDAWAIASRGATHWKMRRFDRALADLDHALALEPELSWAIADRGAAYRRMGRPGDAAAELARAIALDPGNDWFHYELAVAHLHLGRRESAEAEFREAIELGSRALDGGGASLNRLFDLAFSHAALGEAEAAGARCDQALKLPYAPEYVTQLALDELRDLQSVLAGSAALARLETALPARP